AAGFHYAYACDNSSLASATYGNSGTNATRSCTFDDGPGTYTVRARIIDKDNGFTEYQTNVAVNNVAPSGTFSGPANGVWGVAYTYGWPAQTDASSADNPAGLHYAFSR